MSTRKVLFSVVVVERLAELGLTQEQLGLAVGKGKSAAGEWVNENRWPPYEFEAICRVLRLGFTTKTAAQEMYVIGWKRPRRAKAKGGFGDAMAALETMPPPATATEAAAAEAAGRAFAGMGGKHWAAVTSQTLQPGPFCPERCPAIVAGVYAALDAGALFAFIIPTAARISHLADSYGYTQLNPHRDFTRGFADFRAGYVNRRRAAGDPSPEDAADRRTQLFEWHEFPMTACGRTTTLLGETAGCGHVDMWVLERGPGSDGMIALAGANQTNEERLRRYVEVVMRGDRSIDPSPAARGRFVYELTRRMYGHLD